MMALGTWVLVVAMAAYFHAMKLAYAKHEKAVRKPVIMTKKQRWKEFLRTGK